MKRAVAGLFIGILIVLFVASSVSYATISKLITVEGRLMNTTVEEPLNDTAFNLSFSIWDSFSGGSMLFAENHETTTDDFGIFQVILGSTETLDLAFDQQYYLELEINGTGLSPRQKMTSVPGTYRAKIAEDVNCTECINSSEIVNDAVNLEKYKCKTGADGSNLTLLMNCTVDVSDICDDTDGCMLRIFYQPSIASGNPALSYGYYYQFGSDGRFRFLGFEKGSTTAATHTGDNGDGSREVVLWGGDSCAIWDSDDTLSGSTNLSYYCNQDTDPTTTGCYYYFCD